MPAVEGTPPSTDAGEGPAPPEPALPPVANDPDGPIEPHDTRANRKQRLPTRERMVHGTKQLQGQALGAQQCRLVRKPGRSVVETPCRHFDVARRWYPRRR
jgi:hypothetical protein